MLNTSNYSISIPNEEGKSSAFKKTCHKDQKQNFNTRHVLAFPWNCPQTCNFSLGTKQKHRNEKQKLQFRVKQNLGKAKSGFSIWIPWDSDKPNNTCALALAKKQMPQGPVVIGKLISNRKKKYSNNYKSSSEILNLKNYE